MLFILNKLLHTGNIKFSEFSFIKKIHNIFSYNREKYENFLDDENCKIGVIITNFITFLIILFIIIIAFESIGNNKITYASQIFIFDAFISIIFALEYFYRLLRTQSKKLFIINPIRIIDLLSFLPFFIGLISFGQFVVTLRLVRIFRILRLIKNIPLSNGFIKSLKDYTDEYKAVFMLYFVVLFIGSFFVYYVEKDVVGTDYTSLPITLWWGLVTMTTVGFGDMVPVTVLGKVFGSIVIFLGPLVIALATSVTIMVFQETNNTQKSIIINRRSKSCMRCRTKNLKHANYCFSCGKKFIDL